MAGLAGSASERWARLSSSSGDAGLLSSSGGKEYSRRKGPFSLAAKALPPPTEAEGKARRQKFLNGRGGLARAGTVVGGGTFPFCRSASLRLRATLTGPRNSRPWRPPSGSEEEAHLRRREKEPRKGNRARRERRCRGEGYDRQRGGVRSAAKGQQSRRQAGRKEGSGGRPFDQGVGGRGSRGRHGGQGSQLLFSTIAAPAADSSTSSSVSGK